MYQFYLKEISVKNTINKIQRVAIVFFIFLFPHLLFGQAELLKEQFSMKLDPGSELYKLSYQDQEFVIFSWGGTNQIIAHHGDHVSNTGISGLGKVMGDMSVQYKGELFFSTRNQVVSYDGESFRPIYGSSDKDVAPKYIGHLKTYDSGSSEKIYFSAYDIDSHYSSVLRSYDGETVEVVPAPEKDYISKPRHLTTFEDEDGNKLYFTGSDSLWVYNGSEMKGIEKNTGVDVDYSDVENIFVYDNGTKKSVYLISENGDGIYTIINNKLSKVTEIEPDTFNKELINFNAGDGPKIYLRAYEGSTGFELYSFDGNKMELIKDLNPGYDNSNPHNFQIYNNKLFFNAKTDGIGDALYSYNGTEVNMEVKPKDGDEDMDPRNLEVLSTENGDELVFRAGDSELWSYKGGKATLLSDIVPEEDGTDTEDLFALNSTLLFYSEYDKGNVAFEPSILTKYDGTSVEPVITTRNNLESYNVDQGISRGKKVVYDGELYFPAQIDSMGSVIMKYNINGMSVIPWSSTGFASAGQLNVYDIGSGPKLFFNGNYNLVVYNNDEKTVKEFTLDGDDSYYPKYFTKYDDGSGPKLYFQAESNDYGSELFGFDGSKIFLAADINKAGNSYPKDLRVYDDGSQKKLYFQADNGTDGMELWSYNGETAQMVIDLNDGTRSSEPEDLTVFDDGNGEKLYFSAYPKFSDVKRLWSYNGNDTVRVKKDVPNPSNLYVYDNGKDKKLVFGSSDETSSKIWSYDNSGVSLLGEVKSSMGADHEENTPDGFITFNNELYFTAVTPELGQEPYAYNPETGEITSYDFNPGNLSGYGAGATIYNDGDGKKLYVSGTNGINGFELYRFGPNDTPFSGISIANDEVSDGIPNTVALSENYPNPFNPSTTFSYSLPRPGLVKINIYNVIGRKVANLVYGHKSAGVHSVQFDASQLSSGIYFYKLKTKGFSKTKKMMLIK